LSKRKQHAPEFKARLALEALKGETDQNLDLMRQIHRPAVDAAEPRV